MGGSNPFTSLLIFESRTGALRNWQTQENCCSNICWIILYSISTTACVPIQRAYHMHGLNSKAIHPYVYKKSLTLSFFFFYLSFSHITKKNLSLEILLLQPGLWNTIHRSSWWRGNCCKIQLEVYGDGWRWIPSLFLSAIQIWTHTHSHMDTLPLTLWVTWNPPTIIQRPAHNCEGIFQQAGFGLSGQRSTAECAASPALVGGGLLCRGIIRSHLIFISYWEIRDDKSVW